MADILLFDEAQELQTIIRSSPNDQLKVDMLTRAKQKIKHYGIEEPAVAVTFSTLRIGMASSNSALFQHSLSCLGYLIKRIKAYDVPALRRQSSEIIPLLLDKMGDSKDRTREMATTTMVDLWVAISPEVETKIRESGLVSKNIRLKESCLEWLLRVHASYGANLSIKPFTSLLVRLLEDANVDIREKTKIVVVELFREASGPAKADLKKSIIEAQVRQTIATFVIDQISGPDFRSSTRSTAEQKPKESKAAPTKAKEKFLSSLPGVELEDMKAAYVNTSRELEQELAAMIPDFTGKETEQNWAAREKYVTRIRELVRGNAPSEHSATFLVGIKSLSDGIMNAVKSLRTTLSTKGCQCVKDLFLVCGHGMDPTVDIILPNMIKLCGGTKKITAEAASVATAVIFAKVTFHHTKTPNYLYSGATDKNIQPRLYATSWFRALIEAHAHEKYIFEHGDGLKKLEDCLKKGITDANPGVRENARAAFWMFNELWPERATIIMDAQDANTRKLLDKDNPNGPTPAAAEPRPGTLPRSATAGPPNRPSIKEQIAARRREAAAAAAAPKLETAQSYPGPSNPVPPPTVEKGGISSAPVRPVRPLRPKSQLSSRVEESRRPASSSSNGDSHNALEKTLERMNLNGGRAQSPSSSARSGMSPTSSTFKKATLTPSAAKTAKSGLRHSPLSQRKMTILEHLNHSDYKMRMEGIVVLGCVLAGRTPPHYEKKPPVPSADQLAPALQKLVNDPHPEVVESVLAPEVLPELVKFVDFDQVVPRVLLLNEVDESEHPRPYPTKSLATLKEMLTDTEAAELLFRVINSMAASGPNSRKILASGTSFTVPQKRRILHGALVWMNEIVIPKETSTPNPFIASPNTYKAIVNRLIPLLNSLKQPNFGALASLLKTIQVIHPEIFDRTLATFDLSTQRELKNAWGMNDGDEELDQPEEAVAHVEQVLGIIPSINDMAPPPRPNRGLSPPDVTSSRLDYFNQNDEELTMINPLSALSGLGFQTSTNNIKKESPAKEVAPISPPESIDIPDLLATTRKPAVAPAEKEPIQVYQDPVPSILDFKTPPKSNEPLANITNSPRPRPKLFGSSTKTGKTPEQQLNSLNNYMRKLKSGDIDSHGLRRLSAIVRDNPVRKNLQENKDEDNVFQQTDFWDGGKTFEEMVDALLDFFNERTGSPEELSDVRAQGILLLRQLISKASPYFVNHEASILPVTFNLRGEYPTQSPVSTNIEETLEDYVEIANAEQALSTITTFLMKPSSEAPGKKAMKTQACVLAIRTLSSFLASANATNLPNHWETLGGVAKKYLDDNDPEIRRSTVSLCVEMKRKFGDDEEKLFENCLVGLNEGQRSLLTYYFARSK